MDNALWGTIFFGFRERFFGLPVVPDFMRPPLLLLGLLALSRWAVAAPQLTSDDVEKILAQAVARSVSVSGHSVIAVTDREGYVLGVWSVSGSNPDPKVVAGAVSRAGTAAFLSSNHEAFTSRTAGFIIQQHFPPGVRNTVNGPLVGVGLSSIYLTPDAPTGQAGLHSDVNFLKQIPTDATGTFNPNTYFASLVAGGLSVSPGTFGAGRRVNPAGPLVAPGGGISGSSLNDTPGGLPLYKNGVLVGGIGVTGDGSPIDISTGFAIILKQLQKDSTPGFKDGRDTDEDVALSGQKGFEPSSDIEATNVLIGGIRLPYELSGTSLPDVKPLGEVGNAVPGFPVQGSPPPFNYPNIKLHGVSGEVRFAFRGDPMPGKIGKANRLTAEEVTDIIGLAAERADQTRAGIRLPLGSKAAVFICVVGNPKKNGVEPPILGVFRTEDATIFSWDVCVQKARTALFFSTKKFAQSTRCVGFLAERYFPPGLDGTKAGPYFGLQESFLINDYKTATGKKNKHNSNVPNGITIFPGGFPLYRDGELIGAIGVSGDGVDQDDIVAASGCVNFLAKPSIQSDKFTYRGARLPYAKFPRDPDL